MVASGAQALLNSVLVIGYAGQGQAEKEIKMSLLTTDHKAFPGVPGQTHIQKSGSNEEGRGGRGVQAERGWRLVN